MKKTKGQIVGIIAVMVLVCTVIKYIEFLFIRTDQTIIADNVITKLTCIAAFVMVCRLCGLKASDIGFKNVQVLKRVGCGLGLGICTFAVSYGVELQIIRIVLSNILSLTIVMLINGRRKKRNIQMQEGSDRSCLNKQVLNILVN